jgi:hypothetical protein
LPPPGLGELSLNQRRGDFLTLLRRGPEIDDVSFIDRDGKEQLRITRYGLNQLSHGLDRSTDAEFLGTRSGRTFFAPVDFRNGSVLYFPIAVPDERDAGVTVATMNLRFVLEPVSSIALARMPVGSDALQVTPERTSEQARSAILGVRVETSSGLRRDHHETARGAARGHDAAFVRRRIDARPC